MTEPRPHRPLPIARRRPHARPTRRGQLVAYLQELAAGPFVRSVLEQVGTAFAVAFLAALAAGAPQGGWSVPALQAAAVAGLAAAFAVVKSLLAQRFGSRRTATFDGPPVKGPSGR